MSEQDRRGKPVKRSLVLENDITGCMSTRHKKNAPFTYLAYVWKLTTQSDEHTE